MEGYKYSVWEYSKENQRGQGLTQEEFSELCGISRAYYGRIERGEHSATLELCQKISDATGLSFFEIFEDIV